MAPAQSECTPSWQTPFGAPFAAQTTFFALLDLDHDGRLHPIVCGRHRFNELSTPALVYRDNAWTALDPVLRQFGSAAFMHDFDGPGPDAPQLVVAGAMQDELGSPFSGIGRLTPDGWVGLTPNGSPAVYCAKVLDPDADGPLPPAIYIGTDRAGIQRWNGFDFDRLSFPVLGLHSVIDLLVADLDGPGPQAPRIIGLGNVQLVISDQGTWTTRGIAAGGYNLCSHDPDGDGPLTASVFIPSRNGLLRLDPDLRVQVVATPETPVSAAQSFQLPSGPALFYFGLDASRQSVVRASNDLVHWTLIGDASVFGPEPGAVAMNMQVVSTGAHRPAGLAILRNVPGGAASSRLFYYGCPFEGGCAADFNDDGFIDCFDYIDFVDAFESGDPRADVTGDAFADFFDYAEFVRLFQTGC